jgi:hypothetical protein
MFTKLFTGAIAAIVLGASMALPSAAQSETAAVAAYGRGGNGGAVRTTAVTPLTEAEKDALQRAILEEYGARDLYQAVIDDFGSVYPFDRIVRSEQQHASALIRQAEKYGVDIPDPAVVEADFDSLAEACQAGVAAEIADAALYDELMKVTTHTDLLQVYQNLQAASLKSHLPAFQTCD